MSTPGRPSRPDRPDSRDQSKKRPQPDRSGPQRAAAQSHAAEQNRAAAARQRAAAENRAAAQHPAARRDASYASRGGIPARSGVPVRADGPQNGRRRKYKINYRRLTTCIVGLVFILFLIILLLVKITGQGSKKGWYCVYVHASSDDVRIGVVTALNAGGTPKSIDLVSEVSPNLYAVPVQYGGTTTVIVANADYSFNRINKADPDYYLTSITAAASGKSEKQKAFVARYHPSVLSVSSASVTTDSEEDLPKLILYQKKNKRTVLAKVSVGSDQPKVLARNLKYISRKKPAVPAKKKETTTFTFTATGDNLIHQRIYAQAAARAEGSSKYDFDYCYQDVSDFYQNHDLNWINQESLISDSIAPSSSPSFATPAEDGVSLYKLLKMRVFSIANSHIYDQGLEGVTSTLDFYKTKLRGRALAAGLYKKSNLYDIPIYTVNGRSVAFLSYTSETNGNEEPKNSNYQVVTTNETDIKKTMIETAGKEADVVVVGCHWGIEDSHKITDDQKELAQNLADWGADVIIGTHPHVVQNAEWLTASDGRQVFCAYSLGNFLSTQSLPDELIGLVLECTFTTVISPDGSVRVSVQKPLLYPVITVYGEDASDVHAVWYSDYSEKAASDHGVRDTYPSFSYSYISYMLKSYIDDEFLVLPVGQQSSESTADT